MPSAVSTFARVAIASLGVCISAWGAAALADDDHEHRKYDRILKSVQEGKILPLARLKTAVLARWPGEVVGISVDAEDSRIIYEFRIIRAGGQLTEIEVDAADGRIIEVENE